MWRSRQSFRIPATRIEFRIKLARAMRKLKTKVTECWAVRIQLLAKSGGSVSGGGPRFELLTTGWNPRPAVGELALVPAE